MGLKFDGTHKKIDTRDLKLNNKKKVSVAVGSLILSLTMLSGCEKTDKFNENDEKINNQSISSSDTFDSEIPSEVTLQSYMGENNLVDGSSLSDESLTDSDYVNNLVVEEHDSSEMYTIPDNLYTIVMDDGTNNHFGDDLDDGYSSDSFSSSYSDFSHKYR